jgi:Cu-Zn family superoxide dismutase
MKHFFPLLVIALAAASASAETAVAVIKGTSADSKVEGQASLEDSKKGLVLRAQLKGLTPGQHGFHIHEFGDCGDAARAAGSHYNPMHAMHGDVMKAGVKKAHAGDMGNITANAEGTATVDVVIPGVSVAGGKHDVAGRALVVHEKADDFSQPAGNAGGRVGCGVITISAAEALKK